MHKKRKWLFFSLALLCGLALSLTMFSSGHEATQLPTAQKMPHFLKQLSDLYRDLGVQKLSQIIEGKKKLVPQIMADMLWGEDLPADKRNRKRTASVNRLGKLINPSLQKRWGNPAFDVSRGTILATSNPTALESSYLKIRRSWKHKGTWMAFCEFALFKAEEIAAQASITRLDLAPTPELNNDLGSASTGAPRLRYGVPGDWDRNRGYTGNGVVVGDCDTGIDWSHGDFLNPDGTSRILYIWDTEVDTPGKTPADLYGFTGGGPYGSGFDYGTVWTKADIDAGFCTEFDGLDQELGQYPYTYSGHGTHTCGTAAGNGGATGNYTGMAPNADIIFVKGLDQAGIEFIYEMASREGKPAVVNNSWGYSWQSALRYSYYYYIIWFPGDGSCWESLYMDYLTYLYPSGAISVKSAGNDGMWQGTYIDHDDYGWNLYNGSLHAQGNTWAASALTHKYKRLPHPEMFGLYGEYSDFWIRSNKPVRVTVETGVKTYTFDTGNWGEFDDAYSAHNYYDMDLMSEFNGEYCGYLGFNDWKADAGWGEGDWKIKVRPLNVASGPVKYDIWMQSNLIRWQDAGHTYAYNNYDSCFTGYFGHSEYILDFGASKNVYTVGAWTTRSEYLAADGYTYYPWGFLEPIKNTITYFSSPGPSRDGRMKPDIAAPGAVIMSALARTAGGDDPDSLVSPLPDSELDPDMQHQWMWGTSMAAPHATGGIALFLQKFPNSPIFKVRYYLNQWAKKDIFTSRIGPKGFGAGKLNVLPLKN